MLVTPTEFAKATGKARSTIHKAIKSNRLALVDGMIDTQDDLSVAFAGANQSNTGGKYSSSKSTGTLDGLDRAELENERLRQQILKLELENSIKNGDFISRKLVEDKILRPINDVFIRLIADLPRTALLNAKASINAGLSDGPAEKELKTLFEQNIRFAKEQLMRGLD